MTRTLKHGIGIHDIYADRLLGQQQIHKMNKILKSTRFRALASNDQLLRKCLCLLNASSRHYYVDEAPTIGKTPDKESPDFKVVLFYGGWGTF